MTVESFELPLSYVGVHLPVEPGSTVVLRGAYRSGLDGSVVDAVATTWPDGVPEGTAVAPGGMVDLEAGGLVLIDHHAEHHVVRVEVSGAPAPGCDALGLSSPCLVMRTESLAHGRLATVGEWTRSLSGRIRVELDAAPATLATEPTGDGRASAWPQLVAVALVVPVVLMVSALLLRRWLRSARFRLSRLIRRVGRASRREDPVLAEVLKPALRSTARAVRRGRIDPGSNAGRRLERALSAVHDELRCRAASRRRNEQLEVADELLGQVEVALSAAREASAGRSPA
ncbi:MAG: hypothetical protein JRI23_35495 [Deltaproteobacteria bacterium]|nr:hypothetical protein [Deltaproteobacteria bacterium]MBW2537635.1 hypothetical protein [Deltaproteobacteria bacterium]